MTRFEEIKKMNVDELAKLFASNAKFPNSPCYVCHFDDGMGCLCPVECTEEHKVRVYKKWLEANT